MKIALHHCGPGAIVLFLALFSITVTVPVAMADGLRPVRVAVRELASGDFDVQWSVPKVIPPQAMPSPRLPDQCSPEGERTFLDQPISDRIQPFTPCNLKQQWFFERALSFVLGLHPRDHTEQ